MNVHSGFGPIAHRPWFVGAIAMLSLTACATTGATQREHPGDGEMVDIGYGTVQAEAQPGSAETVQGSGPDDSVFRTIGDMLVRIPGVQVYERGGTLRVRIRGTGSFMADEEPLWVLDGMAVVSGAGLSGLNPNAIESVTVLKDPGETAIFGSRGGNGVILVKTKGSGE